MRAAQNVLKKSCIHPFVQDNQTRIYFGKNRFEPFLSHLSSQIGIFKARSAEMGPNLLNMGSKWAHSTCLCTPNNPNVSLENTLSIHL